MSPLAGLLFGREFISFITSESETIVRVSSLATSVHANFNLFFTSFCLCQVVLYCKKMVWTVCGANVVLTNIGCWTLFQAV